MGAIYAQETVEVNLSVKLKPAFNFRVTLSAFLGELNR